MAGGRPSCAQPDRAADPTCRRVGHRDCSARPLGGRAPGPPPHNAELVQGTKKVLWRFAPPAGLGEARRKLLQLRRAPRTRPASTRATTSSTKALPAPTSSREPCRDWPGTGRAAAPPWLSECTLRRASSGRARGGPERPRPDARIDESRRCSQCPVGIEVGPSRPTNWGRGRRRTSLALDQQHWPARVLSPRRNPVEPAPSAYEHGVRGGEADIAAQRQQIRDGRRLCPRRCDTRICGRTLSSSMRAPGLLQFRLVGRSRCAARRTLPVPRAPRGRPGGGAAVFYVVKLLPQSPGRAHAILAARFEHEIRALSGVQSSGISARAPRGGAERRALSSSRLAIDGPDLAVLLPAATSAARAMSPARRSPSTASWGPASADALPTTCTPP